MQLFMLIYIAGVVSGVVGPLPYSKLECEARRDIHRENLAHVIATGRSLTDGKPIDADILLRMRVTQFECEWRDRRPDLGERAG